MALPGFNPKPQPEPEPDPEQVEFTAEDEVGWWRLTELVKAGYDFLDALDLAADPYVDLHLACDLLKQGCTPEQALSILL